MRRSGGAVLGLFSSARAPLQQLAKADQAAVAGRQKLSEDRFADAERLLETAFHVRRKFLAPDDPRVVVLALDYAFVLQAVGKVDVALPLYEQFVPLNRRRLGVNHAGTARRPPSGPRVTRCTAEVGVNLLNFAEVLAQTVRRPPGPPSPPARSPRSPVWPSRSRSMRRWTVPRRRSRC